MPCLSNCSLKLPLNMAKHRRALLSARKMLLGLLRWMFWLRGNSALIILTRKRDIHPTSQGSVTPGKPDPLLPIRDPHRSTKDSTSPVSQAAETTAGNCNFMQLRLRSFISQ